MIDLSGRVALITGSARGIGRGCALEMAKAGADIAVNYHTQLEAAEEVAAAVRTMGRKAVVIGADVAVRDQVDAMVAETVEHLGRLDIAVCNAGGGTVTFADERKPREGANETLDEVTVGTPSDTPEHMLSRVLEINVNTCMNTCMAVAPYMKKKGYGKIVTVSSTAGVDAKGEYHPYGLSKAAIIHYTRALAQELGPYNITVNAIAPGIIRTGRLGDRAEMAKERVPLRREGTIEDCAKVVEFLTTDMSDYVTGRTIIIDGGMLR